MPGIDFALPQQVALLETLAAQSRPELDAIVLDGAFDFTNGWFTGPDACTYYALVRQLKPRRIIEIGSGYSTRIASLAVARNDAEGHSGEIFCIEPYPKERLTKSSARFTLVEKAVQDVPLSFFAGLANDDILMIDSSHIVTLGSDVCYEFLEILPRLNPGVWVHVHDIFLPTDYPAAWVIGERRAYTEQYLLEAFLSGNKSFSPKLAIRWLVLDHRAVIDALCPPAALSSIAPEQIGSSFWMRRDSSSDTEKSGPTTTGQDRVAYFDANREAQIEKALETAITNSTDVNSTD
jgi:hypothetical protein